MRRRISRGLTAWWVAGLLAGAGSLARAQSITISVPTIAGDSMSPAPPIKVTAIPGPPQLAPYSISLELSLDAQFLTPFFVGDSNSLSATFSLDSLLTERSVVFFRARLLDQFNEVVAESRVQHAVRGWLRLVAPNGGAPTIVDTRTPRFVWSSPAITTPPGPWVYDVRVINTANGETLQQQNLTDTTFVFRDSLEANTSYRWQVHARAQHGAPDDETTVTTAGTFVIASSEAPTFTLFYQNFPNPFGRGTRSEQTCFWFDLARPAKVKLTIYDIRLREVRNIIPGKIGDGKLPVGSYGRQSVGAGSGCDDRIAWDGRDDSGRIAPPGIYIAVFEGDGVRSTKKVLFRGP